MTAKHLWIDWMDRSTILSNCILFTNQLSIWQFEHMAPLSIQSIHRCFAVPTRTQFSPRLEYGKLIVTKWRKYHARVHFYSLFFVQISQISSAKVKGLIIIFKNAKHLLLLAPSEENR